MIREGNASGGALESIDRSRFWILATSVAALAVLFSAPFLGAPGSAVVVLAVVILISVKKAAVSYIALGKEKAKLLEGTGYHRTHRPATPEQPD